MQRLELKPAHKPVQNYYSALRQFDNLGLTHETAVRSDFQGLHDHCAHQHDWTLVPERERTVSEFQDPVPELAGKNSWLAGKDPFVPYCREHTA
jgi:Fe2+ or Zn2+ uptake regulation protein